MIESTTDTFNIISEGLHFSRDKHVLHISKSQLPVNSFPPTVKLPLSNGTHVVTPAKYLVDLSQLFYQSRLKSIVNAPSIAQTQSPMDIAPHCIYTPFDC